MFNFTNNFKDKNYNHINFANCQSYKYQMLGVGEGIVK